MSSEGHDQAVEILVDDGLFLESPRWHEGTLWFSDIGAGQVCRLSPGGQKEAVFSSMRGPSGLGWTRGGDILIATLHDSTVYRSKADNTLGVFAGPEQHGTLGTNDMATAGSQSFVTCSGYVLQEGDDGSDLSRPIGSILSLDHDTGRCRIVSRNLRMPNGIAITPDGRTLIVSELGAKRVLEFDIEADGGLSEPRTFAELDQFADGLCLDAEGGIWLGSGVDGFQRIDAGGRPAGKVSIPGWTCIAPMLGGSDGRTLYMVASQMERPADLLDGRSRSRILATRVDVPAAERR